MLFGIPSICHQQGSLSDMGMPPTWEKGSHLPPRTTKLGNLRDSHDSATPPTVRPDSSTLGVGTGTLYELAGSHTRLAIYTTLAIHY